MFIALSFVERQYSLVRKHLFRGRKEQGCFLFVKSSIKPSSIEFEVKDIHAIGAGGWVYQSDCHLELDEREKVEVMLKAREYDCDLMECHSNRFNGPAAFSPSDVHGLDAFVQYVWWKLPNKLYGAVVFTKNGVRGQIWLPKQSKPLLINEIRVVDSAGKFKYIVGVPLKKSLLSIFRRWNHG
ncbi:MAG: hypothetical protein WCY09_01845 [Candidatus Omnitrophota bacterium]